MRGGEVFIPKIPSMRVTDLAEAMAPGAPTVLVKLKVAGALTPAALAVTL